MIVTKARAIFLKFRSNKDIINKMIVTNRLKKNFLSKGNLLKIAPKINKTKIPIILLKKMLFE